MKALLVAALLFVGSMASAATCQDAWGNKATVKFYGNGMSISSARHGNTGFLRANGESDSSYYFRNGTGGTAIVNKAVVDGGAGRVTFMQEGRGHGDGPSTWVRFSCN